MTQLALASNRQGPLSCRVEGMPLLQVMLAAGDTFRAAAAEQLQGWAERSRCQLVARADDRQKPDSLLRVALDRVSCCGLAVSAPYLLAMRQSNSRNAAKTAQRPFSQLRPVQHVRHICAACLC